MISTSWKYILRIYTAGNNVKGPEVEEGSQFTVDPSSQFKVHSSQLKK
jgi:hypothetical protein